MLSDRENQRSTGIGGTEAKRHALIVLCGARPAERHAHLAIIRYKDPESAFPELGLDGGRAFPLSVGTDVLGEADADANQRPACGGYGVLEK
jgi:hypothetical protein